MLVVLTGATIGLRILDDKGRLLCLGGHFLFVLCERCGNYVWEEEEEEEESAGGAIVNAKVKSGLDYFFLEGSFGVFMPTRRVALGMQLANHILLSRGIAAPSLDFVCHLSVIAE